MTWVLESEWGKLGDYGGSFQPLTCLDNLVQTKTSKITLAKTIPHVSPCSPHSWNPGGLRTLPGRAPPRQRPNW
jgi:hypothetical protein